MSVVSVRVRGRNPSPSSSMPGGAGPGRKRPVDEALRRTLVVFIQLYPSAEQVVQLNIVDSLSWTEGGYQRNRPWNQRRRFNIPMELLVIFDNVAAVIIFLDSQPRINIGQHFRQVVLG